jgi:hypothetical protein
VKDIGDWAFSYSGIQSVRISNNVENIGKECFYKCKSLCEVVFESDSKLKEIDGSTFYYSGIKTIRIPSNIEYIGEYCFYKCKFLGEIVFESDSKLKGIDNRAFSCSGITAIAIPSDVHFIGMECFCKCKYLSEITFEGYPLIEFDALNGCPLKCVKVAPGLILECDFPENCTIHEIDWTKNE